MLCSQFAFSRGWHRNSRSEYKVPIGPAELTNYGAISALDVSLASPYTRIEMASDNLQYRLFLGPPGVPPTRRSRCQSGAAILEAGLLLPLLVLMVCGTMDFARLFFAGIVVEGAARAGVQYGAYSVGNAGALTRSSLRRSEMYLSNQGLIGLTVSSRTFCGCNTGGGEVSCTTATCSGKTPSGYVETTATYNFNPIVPYPGIPKPVVLKSVVRFRAQVRKVLCKAESHVQIPSGVPRP